LNKYKSNKSIKLEARKYELSYKYLIALSTAKIHAKLNMNRWLNFERISVFMKRIKEDIAITENVKDFMGIIKNRYISFFKELLPLASIHSLFS
jgi:hypothetical protein